ncbi:MAG: hypothetical protein J6S85_17960 [Methanobrevibacter sp.]|nr:hypothetical protein [Methanobrevibacter sp.]
MRYEYVVTNEYLAEKGLDLNEYALDGTAIPSLINIALDLLVTRICYLDDNICCEEDIENYLDKNTNRVGAFLKAQYRILYNLIFLNETSPTDPFVDNIISHELGLGKINGWQKGIYYRHNR